MHSAMGGEKVDFVSYFEKSPFILMEGALGERLKREYDLPFDDNVALADIIYRKGGKEARSFKSIFHHLKNTIIQNSRKK